MHFIEDRVDPIPGMQTEIADLWGAYVSDCHDHGVARVDLDTFADVFNEFCELSGIAWQSSDDLVHFSDIGIADQPAPAMKRSRS